MSSFISVLSPKYIPWDLTDDKSTVFQVLVASVFTQSNVGADLRRRILNLNVESAIHKVCDNMCINTNPEIGCVWWHEMSTRNDRLQESIYTLCKTEWDCITHTPDQSYFGVRRKANTLYQIISRSQLLSSLNPMHVYWSRQPRAFRCVTSLLHTHRNLVGLL